MVYPAHKLKFMVGTDPGDGTAGTADTVVKDVESIEPKLKGELKTWYPLDQEGWQRAMVTGKSITVSHKGKRNEGDPGNDIVAEKLMSIGNDCYLAYSVTFPSGAKLTGRVAIDLSSFGGGESTDVSALEWDAVFDGKPTWTPASGS